MLLIVEQISSHLVPVDRLQYCPATTMPKYYSWIPVVLHLRTASILISATLLISCIHQALSNLVWNYSTFLYYLLV